jgi:hypothetical protein
MLTVTDKLRYNIYLLVFFTSVYLMLDMKKHYGVNKSFTSCLYVSTTTHTTTGFGDITPKTNLATWLTIVHMMSVWVFLFM